MIENKLKPQFSAFLLGFLKTEKPVASSVAKLPKLGNGCPIFVQYIPFDISTNGLPSLKRLKVMHLSATRITSCSPDLEQALEQAVQN